MQGLEALPDLPSYLRARGAAPAGLRARTQADAALQAFLAAMWSDATDFAFDAARFDAAYGELEESAYAGCSLSLVVTPVEGLVIDADEVPLGDGLTLVRGVALPDAPPELRGDEFATVAVLTLEERPGTTAGSSRPAGGCAGCRPRCGCGTTPSPRSARPPGRAPTAGRGSRSRWRPGCGGRPSTACSRPTRRTRCARSARSSRGARRAPASSPGRCGGSSWAASARPRWRR